MKQIIKMQRPKYKNKLENKVILKKINKMDSRSFQNIFSYFLHYYGGYLNLQSLENWIKLKKYL